MSVRVQEGLYGGEFLGFLEEVTFGQALRAKAGVRQIESWEGRSREREQLMQRAEPQSLVYCPVQ